MRRRKKKGSKEEEVEEEEDLEKGEEGRRSRGREDPERE